MIAAGTNGGCSARPWFPLNAAFTLSEVFYRKPVDLSIAEQSPDLADIVQGAEGADHAVLPRMVCGPADRLLHAAAGKGLCAQLRQPLRQRFGRERPGRGRRNGIEPVRQRQNGGEHCVVFLVRQDPGDEDDPFPGKTGLQTGPKGPGAVGVVGPVDEHRRLRPQQLEPAGPFCLVQTGPYRFLRDGQAQVLQQKGRLGRQRSVFHLIGPRQGDMQAGQTGQAGWFEEDRDEYTSEGIFFVPAGARWSEIAAKAHTPEIGTVIDDAMRAIEKENKRLKDILPKNFARPELDKRRLGEVVDLFTNIQMIEHGSEKDILGRTYEYCLSMFAEQEGKRGGEFFTPSCVVRTLVEVLQPFQGRVYDPCCGSGGMFVQSAKFVESHSGNINNIAIYGQDSNPTTWKMAQMNLAIRGIEPDLGAYAADTFLDDRHPTLRADYILANPPFNLSDWGADQLKDDVRWKYGMPPAGNANFAWLQHMIYHLSPAGKIGMVLANGSLSSQSGGEGDIRKNIIEADLVECIVAMPTQLFYTTQIPVSLWFLNKQKKQPGKTLFIDARNMGTMVTRKLRELTDSADPQNPGDIQKIARTYQAFVDGTLQDEKGFCAVATTEQIAAQDYILTPGRYVGIQEQQDDGEPFEEKMQRLTTELSDLFRQSQALEQEIREKLGAIGYDI